MTLLFSSPDSCECRTRPLQLQTSSAGYLDGDRRVSEGVRRFFLLMDPRPRVLGSFFDHCTARVHASDSRSSGRECATAPTTFTFNSSLILFWTSHLSGLTLTLNPLKLKHPETTHTRTKPTPPPKKQCTARTPPAVQLYNAQTESDLQCDHSHKRMKKKYDRAVAELAPAPPLAVHVFMRTCRLVFAHPSLDPAHAHFVWMRMENLD